MGDYTDRLQARINTQRADVGHCNICGSFGRLTKDHVPPKGVPGPSGFDLYRIQQATGAFPLGRARTFQNGVTFKTLCKGCNNDRLGGTYDRALVSFCRTVSAMLESPLSLPSKINVRLQPNLVCRAVIGHMLAIDPGRIAAGTMEEPMKTYFLDSHAVFPSDIHFFLWLYPSQRRVQVRGAGRTSISRGVNPFVFSLLKFFPLAFMVTQYEGPEVASGTVSLQGMRRLGLTSDLDIVFPLRSIRSLGWPEFPSDDDGSAVLHGSGSTVAIPKAAKATPLRK